MNAAIRRSALRWTVVLGLAVLSPLSAHASAYDWSLTTKNNPIPATLHPGQKTIVAVVLKNVGTETWYSDEAAASGHPLRLATVSPRDRSSEFASDPAWIGRDRVRMETPVVPGGTYGTFLVSLTAPVLATYPQTFNEHFAPVAEGLAWMDQHDLVITVTVAPVADGVPPIPGEAPGPPPPPCVDVPGGGSYRDVLPPTVALGHTGSPVPISGSANQPNGPVAATVDNGGYVFAADTGNDRVLRFNPATGFVAGKYGSTGSANGQFRNPAGVAVDAGGFNYFVSDSGNNRIQQFGVGGYYLGKFGVAGSAPGELASPGGIAFVPQGSPLAGDLVVADTGNNRVEIFTPAGVFVAAMGEAGSGPGQLSSPAAVAVYGGFIFVADTGNDRVQRFTFDGAPAGSWGAAGSGSGCMAAPSGIAAGPVGVFVADSGNDRIQHFTRNGVLIETFGGSGSAPGLMKSPAGLALEAGGTLWAADTANNRIQRFTPSVTQTKRIQCDADPVACVPPPPSPNSPGES